MPTSRTSSARVLRRTSPRSGASTRPGSGSAWELLVDGLATYRLVKLVKDDKITEPARDAVVESQGSLDSSTVSYLVHCPWCLSVYFGVALTLGRRRFPRSTDAVARSFALSAMAGLATRHLD